MNPNSAPSNRIPERVGWIGAISPRSVLAVLVSAIAGTACIAPAIAQGETQPTIDSMIVQTLANGSNAFEQPMGVAIDARHDEIVVANSGLGRVEFFDRACRPRGFFVHRVTDSAGVERDGLPKSVAVTPDGNVLVSDNWAAYVDVCDFRGRSIARIELPAPDDRIDAGDGPGAITVAPDGRVLVASRGPNGRVYVFSPGGVLLSAWGVAGQAPGHLEAITSLAVAPGGEVVITCAATKFAVQVFDVSGNYLRGFGLHDIGPGNFSLPASVVVTPDSRVWVADRIRQLVQVFDLTGNLLGLLGGGEGPGSLSYPSALASDGQGLFALVETGGKKLRLWWVR